VAPCKIPALISKESVSPSGDCIRDCVLVLVGKNQQRSTFSKVAFIFAKDFFFSG